MPEKAAGIGFISRAAGSRFRESCRRVLEKYCRNDGIKGVR